MRNNRDYLNEYVNKNDPKLKTYTFFIVCSCVLTCVNSLILHLHTDRSSSSLLAVSLIYLLLIPLTLIDDRKENRGPVAAIAYIISAVGLVGFYGVNYQYTAIYVIFMLEILVSIIVGLILLKSK